MQNLLYTKSYEMQNFYNVKAYEMQNLHPAKSDEMRNFYLLTAWHDRLQIYANASITNELDTINNMKPKMILIQKPSIFLESMAPIKAPGIEPTAIKMP